MHTLVCFLVGLCAVSTTSAQGDRSPNKDRNDTSAISVEDALFWGPYRPNLYVGVRPKIPDSFMSGLMWANVDNYDNYQDLRHTCEQSDDILNFGWDQFDPREGGRHIVRDQKSNLDISTEFVKLPGPRNGGWALRVRGRPSSESHSPVNTAVIFYLGLDGDGEISLEGSQDRSSGIGGTVRLRGRAPILGDFSVTVNAESPVNVHPVSTHPLADHKDLSRASFVSRKVPRGSIWQAKDILFATIREPLIKIQDLFGAQNLPEPPLFFTLPNLAEMDANLYYFQKTFQGEFDFEVVYTPVTAELQAYGNEEITKSLARLEQNFNQKFEYIFPPQSPFQNQSYLEFGKVLFSNLIGGVGYFHGTSIVDRSYSSLFEEDEERFWESAAAQLTASSGSEEGPTELLTAVPSRAFFPRGFYWDEGFHLIPITLWDQQLSMQIIKSWLALMDENGWIGREQILGPEARSKVPEEFTTQYPHYANPPTLFIAISQIIERSADASYKEYSSTDALGSDEHLRIQVPQRDGPPSTASAHNQDVQTFLQEIYPALKQHYDWFRHTQKGEIKNYGREAFSKKEGYRWRGRTPDHCLTSGLDDYPRARPPHPGELHLDLHSWIGMMTKLMHNIALQVGEQDDASDLAKIEIDALRNLDDLYWVEEHKAYCDQTIDDYEDNVSVCHIGYVTLFPVLLGLLAVDHPHLLSVLQTMRDESGIWSSHGLRSLSKNDPYYGTGENYWRGPIWININYLALSSLYRNYIDAGPHSGFARQIYTELRSNVVNLVEHEYRRSGIFWEQYDPDTGKGQRTKGFTGWTSLVVNIMAEKY